MLEVLETVVRTPGREGRGPGDSGKRTCVRLYSFMISSLLPMCQPVCYGNSLFSLSLAGSRKPLFLGRKIIQPGTRGKPLLASALSGIIWVWSDPVTSWIIWILHAVVFFWYGCRHLRNVIHMIRSWLNLRMQNRDCGGRAIKLYPDCRLRGG